MPALAPLRMFPPSRTLRVLEGSGSRAAEVETRVALLEELAERARGLEQGLNDFENDSAEAIARTVLPGVAAVSEEARTLLGRLLADFEAQPGSPAEELTGVLLCALYELRSKDETFRRAGVARPPLDLLIGCGRVLRTVRRAVIAVHQALCEHYHRKSTLSLDWELEVALQVRSAYARFRRDIEDIQRTCDPEEQEAGPALQSAALSIAMLTGTDIYHKLRLQDRMQLRSLQARILAWKAEGGPSAAARPLWQDLYVFTQLIQEVNRRQELLEHDRRTAGRNDKGGVE